MKIKEIFRRLDFGTAFQRWPISSVISVAISLVLLFWIYQENPSDQANSTLLRTVLSLYIGFLVGIIAPLALHRTLVRPSALVITAVSAILVGSIWYIILPSDVTAHNFETYWLGYAYPIQIVILHFAISVSAFWNNNSNEIIFRNWNIQLLKIVFEGLLFVAVLMLGLSLALLALDHLFGFDIDEKAYLYLIVLLLGIFHPWFVLSKTSHTSDSLADENHIAGFRILTQYVLIPIVMLYMLILYLYGVKILIEGGLPQGWLGKLSLGFCSVSLLTFVLNSQLREYSANKISHLFHRWIPLVLIIPISLLLIALGRRVQDYGITENRYLVAGIAIWLLFIALVYSFKKQLSIKWIPISLAVMLIFQLLSGPFNIFNSTIKSQEKRLALELEQAGLLKDGVLTKSQSPNSLDLSSLRFLSNRVKLEDVSYLKSEHIEWTNLEKEEDQLSFVIEQLNLKSKTVLSDIEYIHFQAEELKVIDISKYDLALSFGSQKLSSENRVQIQDQQRKLEIHLEDGSKHELLASEIYEIHQNRKVENESFPLSFQLNSKIMVQVDAFSMEVRNGLYKINQCSGIVFYSTQ
ncbi:MAG: hypothetical protein ACJA01_001606 [Saprospiraceae bacterium]|jgi:hypothetical protein